MPRRTYKTEDYDPRPLAEFLEALLAERNESYREASLRSGLDHQALRRYTHEAQRPSRTSIMAMAGILSIIRGRAGLPAELAGNAKTGTLCHLC